MNKILIVEDNETYHHLLAGTLTSYELTFAKSAEEAEEKLKTETFDGIIIDINLPHKNGFSLLSDILSDEKFDQVPVFCLSGREEISDKVTAFSLGADDYITKPFDPIELRARIDNRIKKSLKQRNNLQVYSVGNILIDQARHRVSLRKGDKEYEIQVTQTEFKLLLCLAKKPEQVFSRAQLLVSAWGGNTQVLERVVDVHMCLLRKKLGDECTHTVRALSGVGYKLTQRQKSNADLKKLNTV